MYYANCVKVNRMKPKNVSVSIFKEIDECINKLCFE